MDVADPLANALAAFDRAGSRYAPLTTSEVAAELDCTRRTAYNRLDRLVERGDLETKKVGARGRVWWRPPDESDAAESKHAAAERKLLFSTVRSIAEAETFEDGLRATLREVCEVTDWELGEAWIPSDGVLERASVNHAERSDLEPFNAVSDDITFEPDEGLPGRVWASGDPEWMTDVTTGTETEYPRRTEAVAVGIKSAVGVPIATDGEVVAVLVFLTTEPGPADEAAIELASSVATELGELVERRRAEDALERERTLTEQILETSPVGIGVFDTDGEVTRANAQAASTLGLTDDEVESYGAGGVEMFDAGGRQIPYEDRPVAQVLDGSDGVVDREMRIETGDGSRWVSVTAAPLTDESGSLERVVATVADVTPLKEQARRIERQRDDLERELDEVFERVDDAFYALDDEWRFTYLNERAEEMLGRFGDGLLGERIWDALPSASAAAIRDPLERAMAEQERTDFEVFSKPLSAWFEFQVYPSESGLSVYFRDVTRRREREERLAHQRGQLEALDDLNGIVREINGALVRQSTREEVEQVVCDRLADSDSYRFAWVGEVDPKRQQVVLRTEAGVEGYLDDTEISTDPDEPAGLGPTGRAVRTHEMQVTQNVETDADYETWRDHADRHDFRSSAAIPIVHGGTLYGVLNVYAARTNAFEDEERAVIGQLGEVVGHAIASIERKRMLMSDELVELEFQIRDVLDVVGVSPSGGSIRFDRTVPLGDGEYLQYGTVTDDARETLAALADEIDYWQSVSIVREEFGTARFELRLSEPPVVSTVAAHGGSVSEATVEDGDYHMAIHLPETADVRTVADRIRDAYPTAEVVSRRQVPADDATERVARALAADLTERQRATLEAAYSAGFFEWPRETDGKTIADSLGITDSTFHQHVRKAEGKILDALLAEPTATVR